MQDRYFTKREVADLCGVSRRSIDAWIQAGRFPHPERLPSGRPRWREAVVRAAIRQPPGPRELQEPRA